MHEMTNAVDQALREIGNRFDFKGVDASFSLNDNVVTLTAEEEKKLTRIPPVTASEAGKAQIENPLGGL